MVKCTIDQLVRKEPRGMNLSRPWRELNAESKAVEGEEDA